MGDAEIGDQRPPRAGLQQNVVRLDVPMDDAATVRVRQRPRDLAHHARRLGCRERTARAQPLAKRLTLDEAHDEEDEAARFADAMDRDDVRMRKAGRRTGLSHEPLARRRVVGERSRQDLDGDVTIQLHIARKVDDPHAPSAEFALERVLTRQRGLQVEEVGRGVGHETDGSRDAETVNASGRAA